MKKASMFLLMIFFFKLLHAQSIYNSYPVYIGNDLGLTYSKDSAQFRIWSPPAQGVQLIFYKEGEGGEVLKTINLQKAEGGTWFTIQQGDLKGVFYTFKVRIDKAWSKEVPDPYAKATGVNGKRAMVVDLPQTNPPGWEGDVSPDFSTGNKATDAVIYELHIRDATISKQSGVKYPGKYLGLAQGGTKSPDGLSTGLQHIKELGVTHVHLLPFFDYNSVDESNLYGNQYNWGYDPLNFNVPEGSYSTDPFNGTTRIIELKTMIHAFHVKGLRVVMDVVYNHTGVTNESNFNQLVPGYYYRHKKDGSFSDATACGNETASEMPMMRKFMLESVLYWAKEYHIDGFRFDLMGVHDIETMNLISDELHKIKPDILLYGEGWTAGESPLPDSLRALKKNAAQLHGIAVFSDDIRDGIKGSVFDEKDKGFASGKPGMEPSVMFGITAATAHPQVDFAKVNYSKEPYAAGPWNVITYCECHDNNTLWDKLHLSCPNVSEADRKKMHKLALTIVLTSQGIPFLHAGTEFLRTKNGIENSYKSSDAINEINWQLKKENLAINDYVTKLIKVRKEHPAFRMTNSTDIQQYINFDTNVSAGTISYSINGKALGDSWKKIWVAFNGSAEDKEFNLPAGNWRTGLDSETNQPIHAGHMHLKKYSAVVLYED